MDCVKIIEQVLQQLGPSWELNLQQGDQSHDPSCIYLIKQVHSRDRGRHFLQVHLYHLLPF